MDLQIYGVEFAFLAQVISLSKLKRRQMLTLPLHSCAINLNSISIFSSFVFFSIFRPFLSYLPIDFVTELKLLHGWTMLTLAPHLCAITNLLSSSSIFPLRISFCIFARYFRQISYINFSLPGFLFCQMHPLAKFSTLPLAMENILLYIFCYLSLTLAKSDHEIPMKRNLCVFRDCHSSTCNND